MLLICIYIYYRNYVKSKATKAKAESQLLFTNHYIDEMKKVSTMLKEKHKSISHMDSDVQAIQEKLVIIKITFILFFKKVIIFI